MKTVLITGANRGLGLEFARQFGQDGWTVIATCRNPIGLGELASIEGDIQVYGLDVGDPNAIKQFADQMAGRPIDLLINNAGIFEDRNSGHADINLGDWEKSFRINTMAPVLMAEALLANLKATGGTIATVSSKLGSISHAIPNSASYAYRTSKAAVNMAMRVLAQEIEGEGVPVVILHPGWVRTDMGGTNADLSVEESVRGMRQVIASVDLSKTGCFWNYNGEALPW